MSARTVSVWTVYRFSCKSVQHCVLVPVSAPSHCTLISACSSGFSVGVVPSRHPNSAVRPGDVNGTGGARILARPAASTFNGARGDPLFYVSSGVTVRGLMVLYDRMPFPTDAEFADPRYGSLLRLLPSSYFCLCIYLFVCLSGTRVQGACGSGHGVSAGRLYCSPARRVLCMDQLAPVALAFPRFVKR